MKAKMLPHERPPRLACGSSAMVVPLARALVAAEEPVLRTYQISMWGYVVLDALAEQPVRTLTGAQYSTPG
jgi:hypothetical protein